MEKKYTLWEVVSWKTGNRVALVKTWNPHNNEYLNYQHGHKIIATNFNQNNFDWGVFQNGGYQNDLPRCKTLTFSSRVRFN